MNLTPVLYLTLLGTVLRLMAAIDRGLANRPAVGTVLTASHRRGARTDGFNTLGNVVAVIVVVLLIGGVLQ